MIVAILTRSISLMNRLWRWALLPSFIGVGILTWLSVNSNGATVVWPFLLSFVWLPPMLLWGILSVILVAVRRVDLISTEPAVGEVISVKRTNVVINGVPQLAVKMRVNGTNLITECRVLDYVGPAIGDAYNIKISRLNPAVATIVYS